MYVTFLLEGLSLLRYLSFRIVNAYVHLIKYATLKAEVGCVHLSSVPH